MDVTAGWRGIGRGARGFGRAVGPAPGLGLPRPLRHPVRPAAGWVEVRSSHHGPGSDPAVYQAVAERLRRWPAAPGMSSVQRVSSVR